MVRDTRRTWLGRLILWLYTHPLRNLRLTPTRANRRFEVLRQYFQFTTPHCRHPCVCICAAPSGRNRRQQRGRLLSLTFRVPDRGSVNPSPLCSVDGIIQKRKRYGLGLQIPLGMDNEVTVSGAGRGCRAALPGVVTRDYAKQRDRDLRGIDQPGSLTHVD